MTVSLSPIGNSMIPFLNNSGIPLNAGQLYTYSAGTTTPQTTYTSNTGLIANTNPIILGTNGIAPSPIWLTDNVSYKFVLKDSNGVTLETYDNINGQGTISGNLTVGGSITANSAIITTNETVGGNLIVAGSITGGSFIGVTGRIVQTVQAFGSVAYTTSSSYQATGHTATITPTSTSSKILVMISSSFWQTNGYGGNSMLALYKNGTNIIGANDWVVFAAPGQNDYGSIAFQYLDSPTTTSSLTYQPYIRADSGGTTAYNGTGTAILTLLEIL